MRSSGGIGIACEDIAAAGAEFHTVFVCAGGDPGNWVGTDRLFSALRRLSRLGVRLGAISSGAYVLAAARLLNNRDFTIHWEHAPVLREAYPDLMPRQARYVIDGDRITCGGGVAPLDMMHALIAKRMGTHFAGRVSDWYLHTAIADPSHPQRGSAAERLAPTIRSCARHSKKWKRRSNIPSIARRWRIFSRSARAISTACSPSI